MKDIVRVLQDIAETKGIVYHYGRQSVLNVFELLENTEQEGLDISKTYLLHEFTNRKTEINQMGTGIKGYTYEGKFFLVKHADFDQVYFNERGNESESKYTTNIEPLLTVFASIGNNLLCSDYSLLQWDNIDCSDALVQNMDGLLCSYRIKVNA
ncbi:hypothetical protein Q765_03250 [Flavobacterium rivuli WB 3.3-2 = DSM 21788]|uniref:Uncharacterized protein n=1 Tax=Flavobacterium rivuli WB 3.3-2 = DSM 21788 TaxID=1121895 RepID=A0A0A2M727_9FLAO|nr:hypothetical protein [Flavobacterium rivuli]KGO88084.1 hypothetical protein Q765_03250 [Flavobacterium rivuli WB 3.3-2 = DSM 21788]